MKTELDCTGTIALEASHGACLPSKGRTVYTEGAFSFLPTRRASEVRRSVARAAALGSQGGGELGNLPGKLAWIAVVLFVLSVLIAFGG